MRAEQRADAIRSVRNRAEQERLEFFHDPLRYAYATVPVRGHRETWAIRSRDFHLWVKQALFDALGIAPNSLVKECIEEFETRAICGGPQFQVFVRVGKSGGAVYIDLVNDLWQVIEVTESWRILDDSPVKFRRAMGMKSLPYPAEGDLRDLLQFLNLQSRGDEILLLTWLTFALRPNGPYPVLSLSGIQGSGKSTTARILRALIDPSEAALVTTPRSERDLAVAATNGHLIAMDNISQITPQLSDALCRLSSGGSFRTRRLYTDNEELLFSFRCPVVVNGIEELPMRPDLLDRSVLIHLESITESQRRDERVFWSKVEEARPRIFGALLDILCVGFQNAEKVEVLALPRMADFARFGIAVEQALGFAPGEFLKAYRENIAHASDVGLDASPIFPTIRDFLQRRHRFCGTAVDLLEELSLCATELSRRNPRWPRAGNQLSAEIARIEPNLAKAGIVVERGRNHRGRYIVLELHTGDDGDGSGESASRDKSPFVSAVGAS